MITRKEELEKALKTLIKHIFLLKKKASAEGLWLCMGKTVGIPEDDEHQEGENVKKLYALAESTKKLVAKKQKEKQS